MRGIALVTTAVLVMAGCAQIEEDPWWRDAVGDPPADTTSEWSADPGHDPGWDPGYDPGWDPGTEPVTDPGTDPGADPDVDPGTDPGTDPGWDPGTDPGTDPGPDGPAGTIWCVPDPPTSCTSYPSGCCPSDRLSVHCYGGFDITYSCYGGMLGLCGPGIGGMMDCI